MVILSPSQRAVIEAFPGFLMDETAKEMTISGFAGSGKTFLVQYLADVGGKQQQLVKLIDPGIPLKRMIFAATTNKAADVLQSMLKKEVMTIHSTLGLTVHNDRKTGKVKLEKKTAGKNLNNTLLFIDEASMINAELLSIIRTHAGNATGCKLIFIGDSYQLPPVMEDICPVFKPSEYTFFLTEIQRQVEDSPIISLSAKYRDVLDDHTLDWPEIKNENHAIIHYDTKEAFFAAIEHAYRLPHTPDEYKVLAWSNERVRDYNRWIRSFYGYTAPLEPEEVVVTNKPLFYQKSVIASTDTKHVIEMAHPIVRDGIPGYSIRLHNIDAIFFQPNDWKRAEELSKVYAKDAKITKNWGPYFDIKENWADLRPVHASTVHKSQGSTYREVFIDLTNIGKNTQWREVARLVYVAITRASEKVHIFGKLTKNYNKKPSVDLMAGFANIDCM